MTRPLYSAFHRRRIAKERRKTVTRKKYLSQSAYHLRIRYLCLFVKLFEVCYLGAWYMHRWFTHQQCGDVIGVMMVNVPGYISS